jgi:predicted RNA-binding protein associated with RNAse of E/G family
VKSIDIHYRRLDGREQAFRQIVLEETPEYVVTLLPQADVHHTIVAGGRPVLEAGAPVVWVTYPGRWHDVGRFHLADGTFTGYYANILTPVKMQVGSWRTTDLCLDVWVGADGTVELLDEDELLAAQSVGWIDAPTSARVRAEAAALMRAAASGEWPPAEARAWTLERARAAISASPESPPNS